MFLGGIVLGILIAFSLILYTYIYCRTKGEDRKRIEENYEELKARGLFNVIKEGFCALLTPVIILGGIYSVTPTEAACVSVFNAVMVCLFIYRSVKPKDLLIFLREGVQSYAPLGVMLGLA